MKICKFITEKLVTLVTLLSISLFTNASTVNTKQLIVDAAKKHNIAPLVMLSIAENESRTRSWTLNVDEYPLYSDSKEEAMHKYRTIMHRPYVVQVDPGPSKKSVGYFFRTRLSAEQGISKILNSKRASGYPKIIKQSNGEYYRKLNIYNTGVCSMQINYYWNGGPNGLSVPELLEPETCINYAAKFLKSLLDKHSFEKAIGCYYTCGNSKHSKNARKQYYERFARNYNRLKQKYRSL